MVDMVRQLKNEIIRQFGTPCCVIDLSVVEKNIFRAQDLCNRAKVSNRPHIKTHKSSILAKKQLNAGAVGITCQKIGEAEVMFDSGINDILVATNVLGAAKSGRLESLRRKVSVKLCADNPVVLRAYSEVAKQAGEVIDVLVECDTGQKRAGVETPDEVLQLAQLIKEDPRLNFVGLMFYPTIDGWHESQRFLDQTLNGLINLKTLPEIISTGGTPNFVNIGKLRGATEHRAGTCIFNDLMMVKAGYSTLEDCALTIFSSVVSRAGADRGILDSGSKSLTSDTGDLRGYGHIIEYPDACIFKLAEEHGFMDLSNCSNKPELGEIVRVIPNHVCVAVNMVEHLVAIQGDEIVDLIPVEARGMLV